MQEKEKVLGEEEGKTKLRVRGGVGSIVSLKTDLRWLYL